MNVDLLYLLLGVVALLPFFYLLRFVGCLFAASAEPAPTTITTDLEVTVDVGSGVLPAGTSVLHVEVLDDTAKLVNRVQANASQQGSHTLPPVEVDESGTYTVVCRIDSGQGCTVAPPAFAKVEAVNVPQPMTFEARSASGSVELSVVTDSNVDELSSPRVHVTSGVSTVPLALRLDVAGLRDSTSSQSVQAQGTPGGDSFQHALVDGTDRAVIVRAGILLSGPGPGGLSSVTYGGAAMTRVATSRAGDLVVDMWMLGEPTLAGLGPGTHDVVLAFRTDNPHVAHAASASTLVGVDPQVAPTGVDERGQSTSPSVDVPAGTGSYLIDVAASRSGQPLTPGAPRIRHFFAADPSQFSVAGSGGVGTGSVTMDWSTGGGFWAIAAARLPASPRITDHGATDARVLLKEANTGMELTLTSASLGERTDQGEHRYLLPHDPSGSGQSVELPIGDYTVEAELRDGGCVHLVPRSSNQCTVDVSTRFLEIQSPGAPDGAGFTDCTPSQT